MQPNTVIASVSEAIHGAASGSVDCFVASLLAMTTRHTFAISPQVFCARYSFIPALFNQRARGGRAPDAPDSRVCNG
jgi:hypothetical protein